MRKFQFAWLLLLPASLAAQGSMDMSHEHMSMPMPLSAKAQAQVDEAKRVASQLDTPEKAKAAGYRPRFGDVPLQGEHWTNPQLVLTGTFDIEHPPTLMFAPVDGVQKLLGVAYTYEVKEGESTPDGFDGAAMWHEHPALALPGKRLVMTHVWFVPSPNGVFAHDNPTLAFMERDLTVPPQGWLTADEYRGLALTLQLAKRQSFAASRVIDGPRNDSLVAKLNQQRDAVDSMVPKLEAARKAGNKTMYKGVAANIASRSNAIIATIKEIPSDPLTRIFLAKLMDEALSDSHGAKPKTP